MNSNKIQRAYDSSNCISTYVKKILMIDSRLENRKYDVYII